MRGRFALIVGGDKPHTNSYINIYHYALAHVSCVSTLTLQRIRTDWEHMMQMLVHTIDLSNHTMILASRNEDYFRMWRTK